MKKRFTALVLSGALLCAMGIPALAAEPLQSAEEGPTLPDSVLYYGEVKEVLTGEDGAVTGLYMDSEQSGEYVMKVSDKTFWIDSGERVPSSPEDLAAGERLYVFHSPVSTRSMPPQSAAFAVVRNIPQDVGCAMYHKVEAVEDREGELQITTDRGGLYLFAGQETTLSTYTGRPIQQPEELQAGDSIMAWYDAVALSYPGQAYARHIMVLDQETSPLTRSALVDLLREVRGRFLEDISRLTAPQGESE